MLPQISTRNARRIRRAVYGPNRRSRDHAGPDAQFIEGFEHEGDLRRIRAEVLVDKSSQRAILIGEGGARMKAIASQARGDMETLFGGRVYLDVWVRVKSGWSDSDAMLARLGS